MGIFDLFKPKRLRTENDWEDARDWTDNETALEDKIEEYEDEDLLEELEEDKDWD